MEFSLMKIQTIASSAVKAALLVFFIFLFGCRTAIDKVTPLVIHRVSPSATDQDIQTIASDHIAAFEKYTPKRNKLFLFLSGSGGDAFGATDMLQIAANSGYHVISLDYPNTEAVGAIAKGDLDAYGPIREEIITGDDTSTLITVSVSNSIINRTAKLLTYLSTNFPTEGWDSYITDNTIQWSKLTVSGMSQGAGHALYIAKLQSIDRAVLFSGVVDGAISSPYEAASWISDSSAWATAVDRFRFFVSTNDSFYPAIEENLATLGFDASSENAVQVDSNSSLLGKQLFITSLENPDAHSSTCNNNSTPRTSDSSPIYAVVWEALLE
jgi:predicted esterase